MRAFILLLGVVPSLNALCAIQGCDKWYNTVKNNVSINKVLCSPIIIIIC